MQRFSNHFLIAMPHLSDSLFEKSVIYLCEHTNDGIMGIIINKPIPSEKSIQILKEIGLYNVHPHLNINIGGPINTKNGIFLHDNYYKNKNSFILNDKISLCSSEDIIIDLKNKKGPEKFIFTLGYSGWGVKQLETEIENGDWLIIPSNNSLIFDANNEIKWSNAAKQFGIDITNFSGGKSGKS